MELALILAVPLLASLAANAYQWRKSRQKKPEYTVEAQQVLHELTRGEAVLRITVLNTEDFFLSSPKGRG